MDKHFYVNKKRLKDVLLKKCIGFILQEGQWPERDQLLLHVCLFNPHFNDDDENLFILSFLDDEDEYENVVL